MKRVTLQIKGVFIALLTVMTAVCIGLSVALMRRTTIASATSSDFKVVGMSIRTGTPDGLRFVAAVSDDVKAEYGDSALYGMIVVPESKADETLTISKEGEASDTDAIVILRGEWWSEELLTDNGIESGYSAYSCAIYGTDGIFPEALYNTPVSAVGFIIPESGEKEILYTEKATRSISYVATVESLQEGYTDNAVVEKFVDGAQTSLLVNGGMTVASTEPITPQVTIAEMPAKTSPLVSVEYTSDNADVAKIVDNQVVAVSTGTANITATVRAGGSAFVQVSTEITVDLVASYLTLTGDQLQSQVTGSDATTNEQTDLTWTFSTNMTPSAISVAGEELADSDWSAVETAEGYAVTVTGEALCEASAVGLTSLTATFERYGQTQTASMTAGISSLYVEGSRRVWVADGNGLSHYGLGSSAPLENGVNTGTALCYVNTGVGSAPTIETTGTYAGTLKVQATGGIAMLYNQLSTGVPYIVRMKFYVADGTIDSLLWKWKDNDINSSWIQSGALRSDVGSDFKSTIATESTTAGTLYTWTAYFPSVTTADSLALWPVTGETLYVESVELFASNYEKQADGNSRANQAYTYTVYNKSMGTLVGFGYFNQSTRTVGTSYTGGRVCIVDDLNAADGRFNSWRVTAGAKVLEENVDYFVGINNSAGANALFLTDSYLSDKAGQTISLTIERRSSLYDYDLTGNAVYAPQKATVTINVVEGKFTELDSRYQFVDANSWTITSDGSYPLSYWSDAGAPSYYTDNQFATGTSLALPGSAAGMLSLNQLDPTKAYRMQMTFRVSNAADIAGLLWKYQVSSTEGKNVSWIENNAIKSGYDGTISKEGNVYTWTFDIPKTDWTSAQLFLWPTAQALKIYVNTIEIMQVDDGTDTLEFATMSDIHIGDYETEEGLIRALEAATKVGGSDMDLILFNGDLTENTAITGTNEQIVTFKEIYDAYASGIPFMYSHGSTHEISVGSTGVTTRNLFTGVFSTSSYQMDLQTANYYIDNGFRHAIIDGYHFFTLDFNGVSGYVSDWNTSVMEAQLKAITLTDPDRPIFVSVHRPDDVTLDKSLGQLFSKYPQVICFNGHIHNSVAREDAITQQDGFTKVNTGGLNYYRVTAYDRFRVDDNPYEDYYDGNERYNFEQMLYVTVDKNNVVTIARYDAYNGGVQIGTTWTVGAGHTADYTDERKTTAKPCYFTEDSRLIITPTDDGSTRTIKVNFSPCEYGEAGAAIYYQVQLYQKSEGVYTQTKHIEMSSREVFFPNNTGYAYEVPYEYIFEGESLVDYAIVVTAYDCWNVSSNAMVFSSAGDFVWDGATTGRVEQQ